jgi:hypothetical protein
MARSIALTFTVEDAKDETSVAELYVPSTTPIAELVPFMQAFLPLVDDVITGQIVGANVVLPVALGGLGLKGAPLAGSDVEQGAKFIFDTALAGVSKRIRIATFDEQYVDSASRVIPQGQNQVVDDLISAFVDGLTPNAVLVQPSDYRDEDLTALGSALEDFQRSRKRR